MATTTKNTEVSPGSLVALEGNAEQISTQLQLLPPSSKFLILPPLALPIQKSKDLAFNAREFVRDAYTVFSARTETARSFLHSSTAEQPRIAFVNGGCVGARAACIAAITEHVTNGDLREAETIFLEIVKDGVAGLMKPDEARLENSGIGELHEREGEVVEIRNSKKEPESDPSIVAMDAADSLDRGTAGLQENTDEEVEDTIMGDVKAAEEAVENQVVNFSPKSQTVEESPQRSAPLTPPHSQRSPRPSKFGEGTFVEEDGDTIKKTILTIQNRHVGAREDRSTFGPQPLTPQTAQSSYSAVLSNPEAYEEFEKRHLSSRSFLINTSGNQAREGYLAEVQTKLTPIKKVKSSDRFYPSNSSIQNVQVSPRSLKKPKSAHNLRSGRPSVQEGEKCRSKSNGSFDMLPKRAAFLRALETNTIPSPTFSSLIAHQATYVDRGTDANVITEQLQVPEPIDVPFEPVFAVNEDLIIHFVGSHNEVLESVILTYKNGNYPVLPSSANSISESTSSKSTSIHAEENASVHTASSLYTIQDLDVCKKDVQNVPTWPTQNTKNFDHITSKAEPPTPATTPPPTLAEAASKFHSLIPGNAITAVGVQNSLRKILNIHFPPEHNFRQYNFPIDTDRLWKPVFRNNDSLGSEGRNVDQIVAIGREDGVEEDLFNEICGQIEKLGTKKSGISRTGKLDIRYLIANALQSNFVTGNSDPKQLATLLIPQLEIYLATNPSARLLVLTYPASYLSTVLTLQKYLGSDLLKVAGILDALASDPPPSHIVTQYTSTARNSEADSNRQVLPAHRDSPSLPEYGNSLPQTPTETPHAGLTRTSSGTPSTASPSFSRANFLLPSTATEIEILAFLSSILKCLVSKSTFYAAERDTETHIRPTVLEAKAYTKANVRPVVVTVKRNSYIDRDSTGGSPRSPTTSISTTASSTGRFPDPQTGKATRLLGRTDFNTSPILSSTGFPSARNHQRKKSIKSITASEVERRDVQDWENFYISDGEGDDDEIDRILMPRVKQRGDNGKVSSRKALKFLGLA